MNVKVLPVSVHRYPFGDCSNNGISARFDELLVYCPKGPRSFDSDFALPLNFCMVDYSRNAAFLVPAMITEDGLLCKRPGWFMYGGNIADSPDSRFREQINEYPLRIHDRLE